MKFENVKIGMKLKRVGCTFKNCEQGKIYTVAHLSTDNKGRFNYGVEFEEFSNSYVYGLGKFEPVNRFEINDVVIYREKKTGLNLAVKTKIFGVAEKADFLGKKYAIAIENEEGNIVNLFVTEKDLLPTKNKNNLKVGDRFKSELGGICKILCVEYDNEKKEYYCKVVTGEFEGRTRLLYADYVDEIIYDDLND